LAVATRPSIGRGSAKLLDWSLLACLIAATIQLIPLEATLRDRLSPHALAVDRVVGFEVEPATRAAHALSIDVESGVWALALGAAYVGLFWCARAAFSKGGVRTIIRGIAFLGTALTALVAVQRATSPSLLYWTWQPITAGASLYGPVVNRNALASLLAMGVPLVVGCAMRRNQTRTRGGDVAIPETSIDSTQL